MSGLGESLALSPFNEFEFEQSLRLAEWRKALTAADASIIQSNFRRDLASGESAIAACDLTAVVIRAKRLSAVHTVIGGHRAFDILHVAAALELAADYFLSFDANQRKLARAEGLKLNP